MDPKQMFAQMLDFNKKAFDNAFKDLDKLMMLACGNKDMEKTAVVEAIVKDARAINRTALARKVYKKGILIGATLDFGLSTGIIS